MKIKMILIGLMAVLALTGCKKDYEEVKGDLSETRIYTLKNGLKVYLSVNKEEPRIQTSIFSTSGLPSSARYFSSQRILTISAIR